MGFNEIVLVGFDCGGIHSYKNDDKYKDDKCDWGQELHHGLVREWKKMEKWISSEYTSVNIKVVNPIGLKGIFELYV